MQLDQIDKTGLIRESYVIEGIGESECRSIFLDWALKLPDGADQREAIDFLIQTYADAAPDHPMTGVLREGLGKVAEPVRRGGRSGRVPDEA